MAAAHAGFWVVGVLVLLALAASFMKGFHDAAHSITTVVSTGVLKPQQAVLLAASFNFIGLFVFQLDVARTIATGIVDAGQVDHRVVFGALMGAIGWTLITQRFRIPSSASLALVGGIVGAMLAKAGAAALVGPGLWKIAAFIVLAPLLGFALGALLVVAVAWMGRRSPPRRVNNGFRRLQLVSAGLYSLGQGGNDAQKTIGIVWMLLIGAGYASAAAAPPFWVAWCCYIAMALGTLFGGWRVVKTMGQRLTKLQPVDGFCAETGGALSLFLATGLGIPVSTTHTLTGAIVGARSTHKVSVARWGLVNPIVWAWLLTIPAAAAIGALAYALT